MTGLADLRSRLSEAVYGQPEAVDAVCDHVLGCELGGVRLPEQPKRSFLFLGPTGVGKTELARALAAALRPHDMAEDETCLMRLDMSDYSSPEAMVRWLGHPSSSRESVWSISYGPEIKVVLLDEIEKASREILQLLLASLSCGSFELASGKIINLTNVYVIATSNVGAQRIIELEEAPVHRVRRAVEAELLSHEKISPEWVGRWSSMVIFRSLKGDALRKITARAVNEALTGPRASGADITVTDPALNWLARKTWSPKYGARSLRGGVAALVGRALAVAAAAGRRSGRLVLNATETGVELE